MFRRAVISFSVASLLFSSEAAEGAKARPPRQAPTPPAATVPPIEVVTRTADGMMMPNAVQLRATTPAETEANAVWSIRAALNIAALQCQFSEFLATRRNYNDFLRQHSTELDRAQAVMIAHFKRYDGTQAQNSFDRYTTQTYNSFSTLDAQFAFCDQAALAGRTSLTIRKGELGKRAGELRDGVRAALTPVAARSLLVPVEITSEKLPPL